MAAVTAVKLARFAINSLQLKATVYMWTDNQIVLCWIQSTKVLPQFIKHRVEEINQSIPNITWQDGPSSENAADLLTKGLTFEQFHTLHCGGADKTGYLMKGSSHHGTHNQSFYSM